MMAKKTKRPKQADSQQQAPTGTVPEPQATPTSQEGNGEAKQPAPAKAPKPIKEAPIEVQRKEHASTTGEAGKAYTEFYTELCVGESALRADRARELLGWVSEKDTAEEIHARRMEEWQRAMEEWRGDPKASAEEAPEEPKEPTVTFGQDYWLSDHYGYKVQCHRNGRNRPFDKRTSELYEQDLLNGRWEFNGEPIIVGDEGNVLSGQHRLIALILADQAWGGAKRFRSTGDQSSHWQALLPGGVTLPTVINFGVSEDPRVTRTLDNVKPRTLSDVLFCDDTQFGDLAPADRNALTRMADYSIRLLWERMGAGDSAYSPRRTHSEGMAFFDSHPCLKECIRYIWELNQPGFETVIDPVTNKTSKKRTAPAISKWGIGAGTAAGVMYLMAVSGDEDKAQDYHNHRQEGTASEALLDIEARWEDARLFWHGFCDSPEFDAVRAAIGGLSFEANGTSRNPTAQERLAILAKAWALFVSGEEMTADGLSLTDDMVTDDDTGISHYWGNPTFGGVDVGNPQNLENDPRRKAERARVAAEKAKEAKARKDAEAEAEGADEGQDEASDEVVDWGDTEPGEGDPNEQEVLEMAEQLRQQREDEEKAREVAREDTEKGSLDKLAEQAEQASRKKGKKSDPQSVAKGTRS